MKYSKELMRYVSDGDLHTLIAGVEYSTSLREIITVEYMLDQYQED
jgi:hypothetical protein